VLYVTIYLNLAFTAVKHAFDVFAGLDEIVDVLHGSANYTVVILSNHRDIQCRVDFQELLVFQVFVCHGI
jgi:hypothetical protein